MHASGIIEDQGKSAAPGRSLQVEMQTVAVLQRRFLPRDLPQPSGWQIAAHCEVNPYPGGNFYDFWSLPNGLMGLLVADASGHGGAAAVMVAQVRLLLHSCPLTSGAGRLHFCPVDGRVTQSPQAVLTHLNHVLRENSLADEFLTAFYGLLDPVSGCLQFANAGHPLPRLWRCSTGKVGRVPNVTGQPLGVGRADVDIQCKLTLESGDVLVCFSNGLTEAQNGQGQTFGLERLDAAIRKGAARGAEEVKRCVLASLDQFLAGESLQDDLTLLVVERQA